MLKCNEFKNKWFLEFIAFILIPKYRQLITPWDTKWPLELSSNKNLDRERLEQIQPLSYLLFIHYFRIDRNVPCLPPRILLNCEWGRRRSVRSWKTFTVLLCFCFQKKLENGSFLQDKVKECFKDTPHCLTLVMSPDVCMPKMFVLCPRMWT